MPIVSGLLPRLPAALMVLLLLAGCQNSEETASEHLASAQELLSEGDAPRALVELRNALALKSDLHDARRLLADTLLASGDLAGAYVQYTELAELLPNEVEARVARASILLSQSAWTEFEQATTELAPLAPNDPRVLSLVLARLTIRSHRAAELVEAPAE